MAAPIAVAAKKVLEVLASSKKGRKFLGYVIGITLFLILLPVIVLYGLFGGISGTEDSVLQADQIIAALPSEQREQLVGIDNAYQRIAEVFSEKDLTENDTEKAQEIYAGLLIGKEDDESFYDNLVWCFQNVSEEASLYDNLASKFSISFTDDEKQYLDGKYGVTEAGTGEDTSETGAASSTSAERTEG
ncbi:MAG: hypothetical protein PHV32_00545 [Eubacteriales bacterium]|nr:hypothetical protein [Eubacteriales bacterium]